MNESPDSPSKNEAQSLNTCQAPASNGIDPALGASVREDSEAVHGDLRKAAEVATHLQSALAGKSREVAHLKRLLEQSCARFGHLQGAITILRNERHRFANQAMRTMGLEASLKLMTAERDRLKAERDGILQGLADEAAGKHLLRFDKGHVQIVELTVQVVKLKEELAATKHELDRYTRTSNPKTAAAENTGYATG